METPEYCNGLPVAVLPETRLDEYRAQSPNSDGIAFANLLIDRVMKAESGAKHRALDRPSAFQSAKQ